VLPGNYHLLLPFVVLLHAGFVKKAMAAYLGSIILNSTISASSTTHMTCLASAAAAAAAAAQPPGPAAATTSSENTGSHKFLPS
jgi:hypothetical protein